VLNKIRDGIIWLILVINFSIIFLHADSDPFLDVPADHLQIAGQAVPEGEDPRVSVNVVWARGWYPDSVAAFTMVLAIILLGCFNELDRRKG
jgi:hypothetical protein